MAADFFLGESLVGDGNEIAHIDLIIGSKSGPAGAAFAERARQQQGRVHHPARRGHAEPAVQARHASLQQGHDQGREAGGPDVRTGPGGRRPRRRGLGRRAASIPTRARPTTCASSSACSSTGTPRTTRRSTTTTTRRPRNRLRAPSGQAESTRCIAGVEDGQAPLQPEVARVADDVRRRRSRASPVPPAVRRLCRRRPDPRLSRRSIREEAAPATRYLAASPASSTASSRYDGGADDVMSYGGVTARQRARPGARRASSRAGRRTCTTPRSSSAAPTWRPASGCFDAVRKAFFGPMRVSVMLDSNGSNTTAVAAVAKLRAGRRRRRRRRRAPWSPPAPDPSACAPRVCWPRPAPR